MKRTIFFLIFFSFLQVKLTFASESRVEDFKRNQQESIRFDLVRKSGFIEWQEQEKKRQEDRERAAKNYKTQRWPLDQDVREDFLKYKQQQKRDLEQQTAAQKKYQIELSKKQKDEIQEDQELNKLGELKLSTVRPRYALSQRALYGAKPKYKLTLPTSGGSSDSYSSRDYDYQVPSSGSNSNSADEFSDFNNSQPPSSIPFDQQMENNDFPPPYMPDDDIPPPPPPVDFDEF